MSCFRSDGTPVGKNDLCRLGDYETCGHRGCPVVVYRTVTHPNWTDGSMTIEATADAGSDEQYRARCRRHAAPMDPEQQEVEGQMTLF